MIDIKKVIECIKIMEEQDLRPSTTTFSLYSDGSGAFIDNGGKEKEIFNDIKELTLILKKYNV